MFGIFQLQENHIRGTPKWRMQFKVEGNGGNVRECEFLFLPRHSTVGNQHVAFGTIKSRAPGLRLRRRMDSLAGCLLLDDLSTTSDIACACSFDINPISQFLARQVRIKS